MAAAHLQSDEYENVLKRVRVLKEAAVGTGGEHPSVPFLALKAWVWLGKVVEEEVELKKMVDNTKYRWKFAYRRLKYFFRRGVKRGWRQRNRFFLGLLGRCKVSAGAAVRVVERVMEEGGEKGVRRVHRRSREGIFATKKYTMFYLLQTAAKKIYHQLEASISCAFLKVRGENKIFIIGMVKGQS